MERAAFLHFSGCKRPVTLLDADGTDEHSIVSNANICANPAGSQFQIERLE